MIIRNINKSYDKGMLILSACIHWENVNIADRTIFFKIEERFGSYMGDGVDAMLTACLVPALSNGESRIKLDSPVCPLLIENLENVIYFLTHWYPAKYNNKKLLLDVSKKSNELELIQSRDDALFMSGGVDALFSLVRLTEKFPENSSGRIKAAVCVFGFDIGGKEAEKDKPELDVLYQKLVNSSSEHCQKRGIELIPLYTNIRHLDDTSGFWGKEFVGAALSAVAHALNGGFKRFYITSAGEPMNSSGNLSHWGTHPLIETYCSSQLMALNHYALHVDSRIERLKQISKQSGMLDGIRVCYFTSEEQLNCGSCEKCVRTMLQLHVLGLKSKAFDIELTALEIDKIDIDCDSVYQMFLEIEQKLLEEDSHNYQPSIQRLIRRYKIYKRWKNEKTLAGRVKKIIRKFFK